SLALCCLWEKAPRYPPLSPPARPRARCRPSRTWIPFFANSGSGWSRRGCGRRRRCEVRGVADTMASTAARQGGARSRSRHAASGKRGRVNLLCRLPRARARGADRAAPGFPFSRIPDPAGAAAGAVGGAGARYGESPTRWPQPQHGKGALDLARAMLPLGKGAALTCSVASRARAREVQTEPHLDSLFREFRIRLEPPRVRSAAPVRGTGSRRHDVLNRRRAKGALDLARAMLPL